MKKKIKFSVSPILVDSDADTFSLGDLWNNPTYFKIIRERKHGKKK